MTGVRRRLLLGLPLLAAGALLPGCVGPNDEQEAWARALEEQLAQTSGVAEATVGLRANLGEAVVASATVTGIADRTTAEISETASALSTVIATRPPPPGTKSVYSRLLQSVQGRDLTVVLSDDVTSGLRVRQGMAELELGAAEATAGDAVRSTWAEPGPAMLQPASSRASVERQTNEHAVTVRLTPGDSLTGQPLAAVVEALAPGAEQIDLERHQSVVRWTVRAHGHEADEPALVSGVEGALRTLLGAGGGCVVEIVSPWWVILTVGARVEVQRWSSGASRKGVEPIVADLLARVNP